LLFLLNKNIFREKRLHGLDLMDATKRDLTPSDLDPKRSDPKRLYQK
jgi:hypothetical protein